MNCKKGMKELDKLAGIANEKGNMFSIAYTSERKSIYRLFLNKELEGEYESLPAVIKRIQREYGVGE